MILYVQNRAHWLNAKGRPEEVKFWNGRGKKLTIIPEFKVSEFAAVWQSWWQSLQPSWHIQDGLLLSNAVPADEEWSSLCRGGSNGLFIVLMCLSWWMSKPMSSEELVTFQVAKADVLWVLQQMLRNFTNPSSQKRSAEDTIANTSPTKRRRV
jgi:hypothetical protein